MFSYIEQEFIPCDMCKYWNEECDGVHCGHCGRYDYEKFKLDYVSQISKDFNCSRSLAKDMYHAMIVTYCRNKPFRGEFMSFDEFMNTCGNWHIQAETTIVKYDHVIYKGDWCYMPRMLRKCYYIKRFYISNVELRKITLYVGLKSDYSYKLYKLNKNKLNKNKLNKKFGRIV